MRAVHPYPGYRCQTFRFINILDTSVIERLNFITFLSLTIRLHVSILLNCTISWIKMAPKFCYIENIQWLSIYYRASPYVLYILGNWEATRWISVKLLFGTESPIKYYQEQKALSYSFKRVAPPDVLAGKGKSLNTVAKVKVFLSLEGNGAPQCVNFVDIG